ncbi:MAG: ECF transporter S component [Verrucomicrobia bacterium]|nr:ECF transporter S component [Verrucomicrobiota bacterium]
MSASAPTSSPAASRLKLFATQALPRTVTHVLVGIAILLLDLVTGPYLLFPILFVIPVGLAAWYCGPRQAYALAVLLPLGRFFIAEFVDHPSPVGFMAANCLIRITVLAGIAFLVSRTARQTRELEDQVNALVTVCAWSRTVEYEGEWISFEKYLLKRFNVNTSHGISPAEAEKMFGPLGKDDDDPESPEPADAVATTRT